ncbi:nitroreductase family protein [Teredinibacter sp. KSP-S5-2]|uniref:nitroreductase family protein n=1 Tax=Teredinibacter sp. KSP-S5-2 TaxID=3034506 RepID=UPI0029351DD5|nr:nitroreductase family protein [Teredinibacter sp. KSP-S5-2]WNO11298.1 nitroreductase family protein [Teredinibacter sp. KSP-S5-2]
MAIDTVRSDKISNKFDIDPELKNLLPVYPRLSPMCYLVPFESNGVLICGGVKPRLIRGETVINTLPSVLVHLDGSKTVEEICNLVDGIISRDVVKSVVSILFESALLEDGGIDINSTESDEKLLSLSASKTGRISGKEEAKANIRSALVFLNDSIIKKPLSENLQKEGIQTVDIIASDVNFQVICENSVKNIHLNLEVPTLFVSFLKDKIRLGPLLIPGKTESIQSYLARGNSGFADFDESELEFWAGFISKVVFKYIANILDLRLDGRFVEFDLESLSHLSRVELIYPEDNVSIGDDEMSARDVFQHHIDITFPPLEFDTPRAHLGHYSPKNMQASLTATEPLYTNEKVQISTDLSRNSRLWNIVQCLRYAVGYDKVGDRFKRIAPTGGALGSTEAFLIAFTNREINAGVYRYTPTINSLEYISGIAEGVKTAFLEKACENCDYAIVLSGRLRKVFNKYQKFAKNIIHLDAGVASEYIRNSLSQKEIDFKEQPVFSEIDVRKLLKIGLDSNLYQPSNIFILSCGRAEFENNSVCDAFLFKNADSSRGKLDAAYPRWNESEFVSLVESRRTIRSFSKENVSYECLESLVTDFYSVNRSIDISTNLTVNLEPWVVLRNGVGKYQPGIYSCILKDGKPVFLCLKKFSENERKHKIINQKTLDESPVKILITGDLKEHVSIYGAVAYRLMLSRCGSIIARLWLNCVSRNMAFSPAGGVLRPELKKLYDHNYIDNCVFISACLGHLSE